MRSTFGVSEFANHISTYDAASVAGLRAAGSIVFGKSNMPPYAADLQSNNEIFGVTNNPWDPGRTPGGSSGGAAAALAAGLTGLEIGTDMGGSIRVPAAWCGVYGHKPTPGLVSQFGDVGRTPRYASLDLFTPGPMGRGAEDLQLGLQTMMAFDATGRRPVTAVLARPSISRLEEVRVAAWLDDVACPVSADVVAVLEQAVETMESAGCRVIRSPRLPLPTRDMIDLWERLFAAAAWSEDDLEAVEELVLSEPGRFPIAQVVIDSARMSHAEWLAADEQRAALVAAWSRFFADYDVLLCPAAVVVAPQHHPPNTLLQARTIVINGQVRPYWDIFTWAGLTTLGSLPSTVCPVGLTEFGLPVGMQIAAAPGHDLTSIRFGTLLESLLGGFVPPPLFGSSNSSGVSQR
jgi:amidase